MHQDVWIKKAWLCLALLATLALQAGCSSAPPAGITPVSPFDVQRYLGTWYEIARLDHSFERGLSHVTATYSLNGDGSLTVLNRGFDAQEKTWKDATGHALFTGDPGRGSLKVSFFGPFYGGYHIAALDQQDYRWSLVVGPDRDYFWILARTPAIGEELKSHLVAQADLLGIATDKLIWVEHDKATAP